MSSTIYHFEMSSREELQPSGIPLGFELREEEDAGMSERMYREVGGRWDWTDRLIWSREDWQKWIQRDVVMTCRAFLGEKEAGYVEMERQENGDLEIVYFGLQPSMIGRGLGAAMLTLAVERAWELGGTRRVWLHTCTGDHPHAIPNYEKRGFRLFRTEQK